MSIEALAILSIMFVALVAPLYLTARRYESHSKYLTDLNARYSAHCIADTASIQLKVSVGEWNPAICLVTDDVFVVVNVKTGREDVYLLKDFFGGYYDNEPYPEDEIKFYFQHNQQLKSVQLKMHPRTQEKFLDCFQRIAHTIIHPKTSLMMKQMDVVRVEQDVHGVWQLENQCKLSVVPEYLVETIGEDYTITQVLPRHDIYKVDMMKSTHVEINGTLPRLFNGIVRLHMTEKVICYATANYESFGTTLAETLQIPYENIDRKSKKK